MSRAINYRVTDAEDGTTACEVYIDGRFSALLSRDADGYRVQMAKDFADKSINPEELQDALDGAIKKLADCE